MTSQFNYFEEIYCINVDGETEKWQAVQKVFAQIGISSRVKRFSAVIDKVRGRGASLSHLELIKTAQKQQLKNIFIFEDDTRFKNWNELFLADAIQNLPPDWQLFNIGYNICAKPEQLKFKKISDHLIKINQGIDVRSNNAYAINHTVFEYIIDNYSQFFANHKEDKHKWHLDLWFAQNFERYCLVPLMSVQEQGEKPQRFMDNFLKLKLN